MSARDTIRASETPGIDQGVPRSSLPGVRDGEGLLHVRPGRIWTVVHTRPRCEKKVAAFCDIHGIPAFLPLQRREHRYGSRRRQFTSPLFPGYVFACPDADQNRSLTHERNIVRLLEVTEQDHFLSQLKQVQTAMSSSNPSEVLPYLERGKAVRILSGPLKGVEGVVRRVATRTRVILNVDMIGQSVALEIPSDELGPSY